MSPPPRIYLDHHATTPVDPRVLDAMLPYFRDEFGNAASRSHSYGWRAAEAVELARTRVAALIGAPSRDIVFTSGATESNNLALIGAALARREHGNHLVTTAIEHSSVLDSFAYLETLGFQVTLVGVDASGLVEPEAIFAALTPKTTLVSVMLANNEVGTIQPIQAIGHITRERGVWLHVDAAQGAGKTDFDVQTMQVELCSLSAHKIYGPKGCGALYVRHSHPRVTLVPQSHGGGQEQGLRSGTLNVPGIVGFGMACQLMKEHGSAEQDRLRGLRDHLQERLLAALDDVTVHGEPTHRLPGSLNLHFGSVDANQLMLALPELALSSGSACSSASGKPSHVLSAMGVDTHGAKNSIRIGLGRDNTAEQIERAATRIVEAVVGCRSGDPIPKNP